MNSMPMLMTMKNELEKMISKWMIVSPYARDGMLLIDKQDYLTTIRNSDNIKTMLWYWSVYMIQSPGSTNKSLAIIDQDITIMKNELQFWVVIANNIENRNIKDVWDLARWILRCDSKSGILKDHFK